MNDTVIITGNCHSCNETYHTTVCRKVWQISRKQYIPEAEAQKRGLSECAYCAGEFETTSGSGALHRKLKAIGKERAGAD